MARSVKRPRAEPQAFHQLGVRGRKTGVVLQDRGERDEHGMQPLDSIFSPQEAKPTNREDESSDDAGSGEMEIASSDGPGPQTLLKNRHSIPLPLPKSRSPVKTHLNSPARRSRLIEHLSSPSRSGLNDDHDVTVTRKLDFGKPSGKSGSMGGKDVSRGSRSPRLPLQKMREEQREAEAEDDDAQSLPIDPTVSDLVHEGMDMFDGMRSDNFTGTGFDSPAAGNARPPAAGRIAYSPQDVTQKSPAYPPSLTNSPALPPLKESRPVPSTHETTRRRPSWEATRAEQGVSEDEEQPSRENKRQRIDMPPPPRPVATSASTSTRGAPAAPRPAPRPQAREAPNAGLKTEAKPQAKTELTVVKRGRGRPRKSEQRPPPRKRRDGDQEDEGEGDESFMEIQRGPPMPRSRGLVSFRNNGASTAGQLPAGRPSSLTRGVDWWGDNKVLRDHELDFGLEPEANAKNIVRLPPDALPSARAPHSRTRTKAKQIIHDAVEEDEERETWETEDGEIVGDIVLWEPQHELYPPADEDEVRVTQDRLAIAADAIEVRDIPDASFRFAKTLTLPFMGAGVVDLPPDSMKRPKNSRKMHMVFFLHYGKVQVVINGAQFRISAGGTWFVPRGNYYSIINDYDAPARIFFAQASEVAPAPPVAEEKDA
ncbi:hypothetical protein E4U40_007724 [Claviceps sp. LM458 group G5]|nr:hypothetical protein E4U40_007724 [Claviceps sp. LM458 group G5]